jgi:hypothetical protein
MRKLLFFTLLLAGFVLGSSGCQAQPTGLAVENPPLPQTGLESSPKTKPSRLGAVALTIQEQPGTNTFAIIPVSADTGKPIADIQPVVLGGDIAYGFSHDRSQMAFLSNRSEGCLTYCLRIMDLLSWQEMVQPIPVEKDLSAWFVVPEFDEAADIIPLIMNRQTDTKSELLLVDRAQGKVSARADVPANLSLAATTPEGNLAVYGLHSARSGTQPVVYLALYDGTDLRLLWEKTLDDIPLQAGFEGDHSDPMQGTYYQPAEAFTPDGSKLYLVAADRPLLVTVDFQKQAVRSIEIRQPLSLIERLLAFGARTVSAKYMNGISKAGVLSPDGSRLYVVGLETRAVQNTRGENEIKETPLGLQVIDTQNGALLEQIETDANQLALSADGQTLLLNGWRNSRTGSTAPWTEVLDIAEMKVVQRVSGTAYPSHLVDGSPAWLAFDQFGGVKTILTLYRPGDTNPRSQVSGSGYVDWVVIP